MSGDVCCHFAAGYPGRDRFSAVDPLPRPDGRPSTEVLTGSGRRSPDSRANRRSPANVTTLPAQRSLSAFVDVGWQRVGHFSRQEANGSGSDACRAARVRVTCYTRSLTAYTLQGIEASIDGRALWQTWLPTVTAGALEATGRVLGWVGAVVWQWM